MSSVNQPGGGYGADRNFVIQDRAYNHVVETIFRTLPELKESPLCTSEAPADLRMPYVVAPILRHFMERLANEAGNSGSLDLLKRAGSLVEQLSCSSDPEVVNLVILEILGGLPEGTTNSGLWEAFGPETRRLYNRWVRAGNG